MRCVGEAAQPKHRQPQRSSDSGISMPNRRLVCCGGGSRYYGNCRTTVRHHRRLDRVQEARQCANNPPKVIFVKALVFGATLAIAIGPIALLIIDRAARGGLRMGLGSALGAASGDLTYALVALTAGARVLPVLSQQGARIQVGADLILIVFGVWMAWSARHRLTVDWMESNSAASTTSAFRTTYALTVINPLTVVAFMAFVPQLKMSSGSAALVAAAGLFVGSLLIQVGIALGGTVLKHVMSSHGVRVLNAVSAGGIVAFGLIDLLR